MQRASTCDPFCARTPPFLACQPQLKDKYKISDSDILCFSSFEDEVPLTSLSVNLPTYLSVCLIYLKKIYSKPVKSISCIINIFFLILFYIYRNEYSSSYLLIHLLWVCLSFYL